MHLADFSCKMRYLVNQRVLAPTSVLLPYYTVQLRTLKVISAASLEPSEQRQMTLCYDGRTPAGLGKSYSWVLRANDVSVDIWKFLNSPVS